MACDTTRCSRENPSRGLLFVPLLIAGGLLAGCFRSDSLGPLFGSNAGGNTPPGVGQGYLQGTGGGVVLRELFAEARIQSTSPTIQFTYPAAAQTNINVRSLAVVQFSESVDSASALTGIRVFPSQSSTPVAGTVTLVQGQTVAIFSPTSDLVSATTYEIEVSGSITDLQGNQISGAGGGGGDQRIRFVTAASTADPPLRVEFTSPKAPNSNVVRSTEVLVVFSEAVSTSLSGPGLLAAGNLIVKVNNQTLASPTDYIVLTLGGSQLLGARVLFNDKLAADADVDVIISERVQSADGQHTLSSGGRDFQLDFSTQDISIPEDILFPDNMALEASDGFLSLANKNAFKTDIDMTQDGRAANDVTLLYFDASQQNALVFDGSASDPTKFNVNLEPVPGTPALLDGDVVVGAYVQRNTTISEVSVVKILTKDTLGPFLTTMGPPTVTLGVPPFSSSIFYSYVNDPILYGFMDEPCSDVRIEFNTDDPDFAAVQFAPGVATVTNNLFFTGLTEDFQLAPRFEPYQSSFVIPTDQFGNGSAGFDTVIAATVGCVGATVASPDGTTALYVQAQGSDDFAVIGLAGNGKFGKVVLDEFPPDPNPSTNQLAKGFDENNSLVRFSNSELASLTTSLITVTVISDGYDVWTVAGIAKPSAVAPRAVMALLRPINPSDPPPVTLNINGTITGSQPTRVGASDTDLDTSTIQGERVVTVTGSGDTLVVSHDRPQVVAAVEEQNAGVHEFTASEPFAESQTNGLGAGNPTLDFSGTAVYRAADPGVPQIATFDNDAVSDGGSVGLLGSEATQFRRARLLARLPGFVVPVALDAVDGDDFAGFNDTVNPARTATVLKPGCFLINDSEDVTGVEDTTVELLLQPDLIDPATAVDSTVQNQKLWVEMHIEDTVKASNGNATAAFTRQRFLTGQASQAAAFQDVPMITSLTTLTFPPLLDFTEVNSSTNAVHVLTIVATSNRRWQIFIPVAGGPVSFQVPDIDPNVTNLTDSGVTQIFEFSSGQFAPFVETYCFDPAGATGVYQFNINSFFTSDMEREHFFLSRSDPVVLFTW